MFVEFSKHFFANHSARTYVPNTLSNTTMFDKIACGILDSATSHSEYPSLEGPKTKTTIKLKQNFRHFFWHQCPGFHDKETPRKPTQKYGQVQESSAAVVSPAQNVPLNLLRVGKHLLHGRFSCIGRLNQFLRNPLAVNEK